MGVPIRCPGGARHRSHTARRSCGGGNAAHHLARICVCTVPPEAATAATAATATPRRRPIQQPSVPVADPCCGGSGCRQWRTRPDGRWRWDGGGIGGRRCASPLCGIDIENRLRIVDASNATVTTATATRATNTAAATPAVAAGHQHQSAASADNWGAVCERLQQRQCLISCRRLHYHRHYHPHLHTQSSRRHYRRYYCYNYRHNHPQQRHRATQVEVVRRNDSCAVLCSSCSLTPCLILSRNVKGCPSAIQ